MRGADVLSPSWHARISRWLPRVAFVLYALPLLAAPLLLRANNVVAQADTASYLQLADRFALSRSYGDHWAPQRTTPVVAQEHKVKHILYVLVASTAVRLGKPLGLSTLVVTQWLNALLAAMALAVFLRLLALYEVPNALAIPLVGLYATAPGQWVYAGVPESWPLSGLLTVCLLFVARRWPGHPVRLGALAGVAMLNNPVLGGAALLVCTDPRAAPRLRSRLRDGAIAVVTAVLVWLGVLTLLSAFDPAFRPDHYLVFLRWFRSAVGENALAQLWFIRHAVMNTLLLPFASSTASHDLVLMAVEDTWDASGIGRVSLSAIATLWLVVGGVAAHQLWRGGSRRSRGAMALGSMALGSAALGPLLFLAVVWMSYYAGSPESMLLYSSTMIPVLLLLAALALTHRRWAPALVWVVWLACMPAAVQQMHWYRRIAFDTTLPANVPDDPAWPAAD